MTQAPGQSESTAEQRCAELERGIEETRQKLASLLGQQRMARVQTLVASIVVLLIIGIFVYRGYLAGRSHYEQNFTKDKILAVWETRSEALIEKVKTVAEQAYKDVVPVYTSTIRAKLDEIAPAAEANARAEFEALEGKVQEDLNEVLNTSLANVQKSLQTKLSADFGYLMKESPDKAFAPFMDTMNRRLPLLKDEIEKAAHEEGMAVLDVLEKFDVGTLTEQNDRTALEKEWLHLLLMYADYELSLAGTEEALPFGKTNFWGEFFRQFDR